MISVENIEVFGWKASLRGMRNPLNSWEKSDSIFDEYSNLIKIGPNDLKLACNLVKAGSSDRKFLRMIHVQMDVTAPLYWWKECDQYRISCVTNSQSTMHKIHSRDLTLDDISHDHLNDNNKELMQKIIDTINSYRSSYTKDKEAWYQMIQLLPSSFNQKRTFDLNYETLLGIYNQRHNHKLDEWREFCEVIKNLPYMNDFIEASYQKS